MAAKFTFFKAMYASLQIVICETSFFISLLLFPELSN